jgi:hypothetical protein
LVKSKELDLAFAACKGFTMAEEEVRLLNLEQPKVNRWIFAHFFWVYM